MPVAVAAPTIPNKGVKVIFRKMLTILPYIIEKATLFASDPLFNIAIKKLATVKNMLPTKRIISAVDASTNLSENKNIIRNFEDKIIVKIIGHAK